MDEEEKKALSGILERGKREGEKIVAIGEVRRDRIVRVVVQSPKKRGKPMVVRAAAIMASDEASNEVIIKSGGRFVWFSMDEPCLFDPNSRTATDILREQIQRDIEIEEERLRRDEEDRLADLDY